MNAAKITGLFSLLLTFAGILLPAGQGFSSTLGGLKTEVPSCPYKLDQDYLTSLELKKNHFKLENQDSAFLDFYADATFTLEAAIADKAVEKIQLQREWVYARDNVTWMRRNVAKQYRTHGELVYAELQEKVASCHLIKHELTVSQMRIALAANLVRVELMQKVREEDPKDIHYLRVLEYKVKVELGKLDIALAELGLEGARLYLQNQKLGQLLGVPGFNGLAVRDATMVEESFEEMVSTSNKKIELHTQGKDFFFASLSNESGVLTPSGRLKAKLGQFISLIYYGSKSKELEIEGGSAVLLSAASNALRDLVHAGSIAHYQDDSRAQLLTVLESLQSKNVKDKGSGSADKLRLISKSIIELLN